MSGSNADNDVYFFPTIEAAYAARDRRQALARAFAIIRRLGQRPAYARGYEQFRVWMETVALHATARVPRPVSDTDRGGGEGMRFDVYLADRHLTQLLLPLAGGSTPIPNAAPGRYRIVSQTGRVLLDTTLASEDLAESAAPAESLPKAAAADTTTQVQPSQSFFCFMHRLRLDAYRGLDVGVVRLTLAPPGARA